MDIERIFNGNTIGNKRDSSGNTIEQIVSGSNIGTREQNQELTQFWNTKYKGRTQDEIKIRNAIKKNEMVMTYLEMDLYSKKGRNYGSDSALVGYKYGSSGGYGQKHWPEQIPKNRDHFYLVGRNMRFVYLNISDIICTEDHFNTFISSNNDLNLTYFKKWLLVMGYIVVDGDKYIINGEKCQNDFDEKQYYFKDSSNFAIKRPFYKAKPGIKFKYPVDGKTYTLVRSPIFSKEGPPHKSTEHPRYSIDGNTKETTIPTIYFRTETAPTNNGFCYFRFVNDDELAPLDIRGVLNNTGYRGGRKTKRKSKKAKKKSRKQKKRLVRKTRNKRSKRTRKH